MIDFFSRLDSYMIFKGLNDNKITVQAGISNGLIGKGRKRGSLSQENISKILYTYSDLDANWLLTGKGKMLKGDKKKETLSIPQVVTVTPQNKDNVVLVPVKAQAGYLNGYNDPKFIKELPSYNLPNIRNGVFRMFQVEGRSMFPTIHSNSYVVGQFVEDFSDIKDGRIYVVVTEKDGVIIKRVLNRIEKYGSLYCKSDNRREYPSFSVDPQDIKEVWECKMLLSYEFLDPAEIYDKVNDLEAEMLHLKDLYQSKVG